MRVQALEKAQRKARKKAGLDRWAEAEANRLAKKEPANARPNARQNLGKTQKNAPQPPPRKRNPRKNRAPITGKRPPANVSLDEVRKSVTAQIRKALPDIAAAIRENGDHSG